MPSPRRHPLVTLARPARFATLVQPPRRLSGRARRLPWVIARETATGRFEVGAGAALVTTAERTGASVEYLLRPFTDAELMALSRLDDAAGGLPADVEALQVLLRHGLNVSQAGRALGIRSRADAQKLSRLAELHPRVLAACHERGLTANHARWLIGVDPAQALARVMGVARDSSSPKDRDKAPTVAELKRLAAADRETPEPAPESPPPPVPPPERSLPVEASASIDAEVKRLTELLATKVELTWGPEGAGELRVGFVGAEALVGVLERMGRFGHPCPPHDGKLRFATLPFGSLDELSYLVGTADG